MNIRMSVVDLVVLGFLLKEPMNAYKLAQIIDKRQLDRLLKISRPVIYKSCRRLFKADYLSSQVIRESEAPEKVLYSVNAQGKKHFYSLMQHYSSQLNNFHFEYNSFIWNLHHCDYQQGLDMLQSLQQELKACLSWLQEHEKQDHATSAFCVRMVVKQYRMVVTAMVLWIDETIEEYIAAGGAM